MAKLIRMTTSALAFKYLLKTQMAFMQRNGLEVVMISSDGPEMKEVIKTEQCKFIPVQMNRAITPVNDIKGILKLIKIFKAEKPDIVHTHTPKAGLMGMIAARISGVPIRLHSNSGTPLIIAKGIKRWMYFLTEYLTCTNATTVLPNSKSLYQYLLQSKVCKNEKLFLIGKGSTNGIDSNYFNQLAVDQNKLSLLKEKINWSVDNFYFLFVGRLLASKGVEELINAFQKLNAGNPRFHLILAGNIESHLDQLSSEVVHRLQSSHSIHLLGWVDDVRVPMALSNVLVHPSHREGFPNVLLQAGAMKLPVLCSDCIGNIDVITDKYNGLMFPVKNTAALLESMEYCLINEDILKELADNHFQFTLQNYSTANVQKNLLSFYHGELAK